MRTKMAGLSRACLLAYVAFADVAAARRVQPDVEIIGFDYAFKAPSELPPGLTTFRFRNQGKHRHELNIVQLKAGVTLRQFIDAANASKPLSPMIERTVGVLFAEARRSVRLGTQREPRRGRHVRHPMHL